MPEEMVLLSTGQVVRGRYATYRLLTALHAPTAFKAQMLDSLTIKSEFAVVKTALGPPTTKALRRERNNYLIPGIRSSPYIRSQYDILEPDPRSGEDPPLADETATAPAGMVFEWMEYDLWQVPSERFRRGRQRLREVAVVINAPEVASVLSDEGAGLKLNSCTFRM